MDSGVLAMIFLPLLILYLLPILVAEHRGHPQFGAITVLTLLLGWTFLGWVIALVWACTATSQPTGTHHETPLC